MAKNSSIEWTDHTFNPWWGCSKVSPGCDKCYAETWAKRLGLKVWGKSRDRRFFSDKHWNEPLKWNVDAVAEQSRKRVFCASMADVFEDRAELAPHRERLWKLILKTPHLDWLLLTKRPQNVSSMVPWMAEWPKNVWLGTTVEDQARANERLPVLLSIPAATRFLSCEPLLGRVDLRRWTERRAKGHFPIDWVIAGGESGPGARPMFPTWARQLRDQCQAAKIPFHFKQWGHWAPTTQTVVSKSVQQFWDDVAEQEIVMEARGKKDAGRDLDGQTWDELPQAA